MSAPTPGARLRPPPADRRRLAALYGLVLLAAHAETGDAALAARVARRAFLDAVVEGLP